MKKVEIYTHETCPYCKMAKEYLKEKGISYTDYDVRKDESKAQEMIELSGQMGVPVLVVADGDKQNIVVGFDKGEIDKALAA